MSPEHRVLGQPCEVQRTNLGAGKIVRRQTGGDPMQPDRAVQNAVAIFGAVAAMPPGR
jgi:hypothetical protein